MELFVIKKPLFEKIAAFELEEDPSQWPRQVLTELFRELPEISEYTPEVKFLKFDEERGYAHGVVVVRGDTQTALSSSPVGDVPPARCYIPIIIKEGKLCSLDIVMSASGKMAPLTPERLREAMYRPEGFSVVTEDWNDTSLWGMFHPPGRSDANYASGISQGLGGGTAGISYIQGPGMKMAMLESISSSILEPDVAKLASLFETNPEYLRGFDSDSAFIRGIRIIGDAPTLTPEKVAAMKKIADITRGADAVQFSYDGDQDLYKLKLARREEGTVTTILLSRGDMLKLAEEQLTRRVDTHGTTTASEPSSRAVIISEGGTSEGLRVLTESSPRVCVFEAASGAKREGAVYVNLIDATGARLPLSLFVGDDGYSLQDQIAGADGGDRKSRAAQSVSGKGIFVWGTGYRPLATVPLTIRGGTSLPGNKGLSYDCVDFTGMPLTVKRIEGLEDAVAFPDRHELNLPSGAYFVQLRGKELDLISEGIKENIKSASRRFVGGGITLFPAGDSYLAKYHQVPKLAEVFGSELSEQDAIFMLCTAGLSTPDADSALRKVASTGSCEIRAMDIGEKPQKKIASKVGTIHELRKDLVKEAAVVLDSSSVDAVLSLGFINSENVRTFIAQIPYLEKALNRLCELALASRLGLTEIPEAAAIRAARGLDSTLKGLKALALREINELS